MPKGLYLGVTINVVTIYWGSTAFTKCFTGISLTNPYSSSRKSENMTPCDLFQLGPWRFFMNVQTLLICFLIYFNFIILF